PAGGAPGRQERGHRPGRRQGDVGAGHPPPGGPRVGRTPAGVGRQARGDQQVKPSLASRLAKVERLARSAPRRRPACGGPAPRELEYDRSPAVVGDAPGPAALWGRICDRTAALLEARGSTRCRRCGEWSGPASATALAGPTLRDWHSELLVI